MTTGPSFQSDEELIKRLQSVLRSVSDGAAELSGTEHGAREARHLAAELAERIFDDPEKWGIASIPRELRDDAAADAFVALLVSVPKPRGRQSPAEWFASTVESSFRRLWSVSERQAAERERLASEPGPAPAGEPEVPTAAGPSVFEASDGVWEQFEREFPRDAFALRLRYMLRRSPEEMVVMLDAPSPRAITARLNRARDRFKMFCEQSGFSRRETGDIMEHFAEGRSS